MITLPVPSSACVPTAASYNSDVEVSNDTEAAKSQFESNRTIKHLLAGQPLHVTHADQLHPARRHPAVAPRPHIALGCARQ